MYVHVQEEILSDLTSLKSLRLRKLLDYTPLLNHSVCCVFRVTNFHGVMCVTTQYAAQSLRCETVLGAADTAQAAVVLWSFGEKGNTLILDILETNLHLKC